MIRRRSVITWISHRLGARELFWGGLRSDDVQAISDLPQLAGSFSIIGGHGCGGVVPRVEYEDYSQERLDLDTWDIEQHADALATQEFRSAILRRLASKSALLPYRPSTFLSSLLFSRRDRCLDLGLFGPHQAVFEHKPWVESRLGELGVPHVPWIYVVDEEQDIARQLVARAPIVLRVSRSSGGVGMTRVDTPDELRDVWPSSPEGIVGVAPFLEGAVPVNIGATVWHDGVTMQHPSVQLIGIPSCAIRPFGYCGNDFGLARELDRKILDTIEASVLAIGTWLRGFGYRGTFGVDFLVHEGAPLFGEVNARFQGSTHASSQLSEGAGTSCLFLDHIAAMLGHDAPQRVPLWTMVRDVPDFGHVILHAAEDTQGIDASAFVQAARAQPSHVRTDLVAKPGHQIRRGGVAARVTASARLTSSGFDLLEPWESIAALARAGATTPGRASVSEGCE